MVSIVPAHGLEVRGVMSRVREMTNTALKPSRVERGRVTIDWIPRYRSLQAPNLPEHSDVQGIHEDQMAMSSGETTQNRAKFAILGKSGYVFIHFLCLFQPQIGPFPTCD